jgi:hypothetical protein
MRCEGYKPTYNGMWDPEVTNLQSTGQKKILSDVTVATQRRARIEKTNCPVPPAGDVVFGEGWLAAERLQPRSYAREGHILDMKRQGDS